MLLCDETHNRDQFVRCSFWHPISFLILQRLYFVEIPFENRCVEREDGKTVTFKKFPGDTEEAIQAWKIIREDVKLYAKKNLNCTYMKIEDELSEYNIMCDLKPFG